MIKSKTGSSSESEGADQGLGVEQGVLVTQISAGVQGHFLPCLEEQELPHGPRATGTRHIWSLIGVALWEGNKGVLIFHSKG